MPSNELAKIAADRITATATARGLSVNKLLAIAGVNKSVVDGMKIGSMPSADKISAIARALGVPSDYILGIGVFERWDFILEHKTAVVSSIADMMGTLSSEMRNGVDDLSLARLVSAFNLEIEMGNDPPGLELLVTAPFSTQSSSVRVEKAPVPGMTENGREMLELFGQLSERDQLLVLGRLQEMTSPTGGKGSGDPPASSAGRAG